VPLWLRETRRRVYCSAYNQDKSISTFLGRPIRISQRHADISMPLDLGDDETTGDREATEQAIQALDAEGWNTKERWLRASWIRVRHISLRFREEILEFSLLKIDATVEKQLLYVVLFSQSTYLLPRLTLEIAIYPSASAPPGTRFQNTCATGKHAGTKTSAQQSASCSTSST
jgi:hypothetical protein